MKMDKLAMVSFRLHYYTFLLYVQFYLQILMNVSVILVTIVLYVGIPMVALSVHVMTISVETVSIVRDYVRMGTN